MKTATPENFVNEYIANCPKEIQIKLKAIRFAIKDVAPNSTERTDYFKMPGYSLDDKKYDYHGMFAWFSFKDPYIRLHIRPEAIKNHKKELSEYKTTTGIINFPKDKNLPMELIEKLVAKSIYAMKNKSQ